MSEYIDAALPPRGLSSISGIRVQVASMLAGSKRAIKSGNTIYVSPAMYDLMKHAEGEELERLLRAIPLLDLGPDPFAGFFSTPLPPFFGPSI